MKRIESFSIDHTRLKRGIYVSRCDFVGSHTITTFDLRLKEPNREPALSPEVAHTIEHIGATFLRNHSEFGEKTIYFGPMGCLTGFYLIINENSDSKAIAFLIRELFDFVVVYEGKIPGASPIECGNYRFMDLAQAKVEAKKYLSEVLNELKQDNLVYPQ